MAGKDLKKKKKKSCCGKKLGASQVYQQLPVFKLIDRVKDPKLKNKLLDLAGPRAINSVSSICRDIIAGRLKIKNPSLRKEICEKRRLDTEALAANNTPYKRKKAILIGQKGGSLKTFIRQLLPALGTAIVSFASPDLTA